MVRKPAGSSDDRSGAATHSPMLPDTCRTASRDCKSFLAGRGFACHVHFKMAEPRSVLRGRGRDLRPAFMPISRVFRAIFQIPGPTSRDWGKKCETLSNQIH